RELVNLGFAPAGNRIELKRAVRDSELNEGEVPFNAVWSSVLGGSDVEAYSDAFVEHSRFRSYPVSEAKVSEFYRRWIGAALERSYDDGLWNLVSGQDSLGFCSYRQR